MEKYLDKDGEFVINPSTGEFYTVAEWQSTRQMPPPNPNPPPKTVPNPNPNPQPKTVPIGADYKPWLGALNEGSYAPVTDMSAIIPPKQPSSPVPQKKPAGPVGIAGAAAAMGKADRLKELEAREPEARKFEDDWERQRSAIFVNNSQWENSIAEIEQAQKEIAAEQKAIDLKATYTKPDGSEITGAEYFNLLEAEARQNEAHKGELATAISDNRKYVEETNASSEREAFRIRQPKEYERQEKQKELDSISKEYEEYKRAFNVAYKMSRQHEAGLPGGGLFEALLGETIGGRKRATPEQFMRWKAGRLNVGDIGDLWLPDKAPNGEALKEDGLAGKAGQALGNITYGITKVPRVALHLENGESAIKRAQAVKEGYGKQDQINEIKERQAKGEPISDDDKTFLIENDKNAAQEFWEGVKSIPELLESFNSEPGALREFVNDMVAYWPATAGVGFGIKAGASGIEGAVKMAWQAKRTMKAASKAKKIEQNAEKVKEVMKEWKASQKEYAGKAAHRAETTENPLSLKSFAKEYGKSATEEAIAEALVETGYGEDFDLGSIARNLGEDLGMQGLPSAVLRVAKRILQSKAGIVTPKEYDAAYGTHGAGFARSTKMGPDGTPGVSLETEGNVIMDVGTGNGYRGIGKSIEAMRARPNVKSEIKKLAELRNNAATAGERYRFLDKVPEDAKEAASKTKDYKEGKQDVAGFREMDKGISNITPKGDEGTIIHETLHGLEFHPKLAWVLAKWKANAMRWAKENGIDIPDENELVAQTFAHRLGYPEPQAAKVKDIPVPNELLQEVEKAVGKSEEGASLRGDRFVHAKDDEQDDPNSWIDEWEPDPDWKPKEPDAAEEAGSYPFSLANKPQPSMEEARQSVPEQERGKLERLFEAAAAGKGNPNAKIPFNKPSNKLKSEVNRVLGKNLDIENQVITLGHIRHINDRHGVGNEANQRQIPVTKESFALIPHVLNNFDTIEKSDHSSRGADVVKITKRYADGTMIIADAILQKNDLKNPNKADLEIRTVYIKEPKKARKEVLFSAPNYSSLAGQAGVTGKNLATNNIQKNPAGSAEKDVSREKDVRFSLTDKADPYAWHGSPHSFAKFDHKHMGTGEGAQVYGYGSYFTDRKDIAEKYAERKKGKALLDGEVIAERDGTKLKFNRGKYEIEEKIAQDLTLFGSVDNLIDYYEREIEDASNSRVISDSYKKHLAFLKANADRFEVQTDGRNLYKTRIKGGKSADELNLMRWDEPPSEEQVDAIMNADGKLKPWIENWLKGKNLPGERFYKVIESFFGSDKAASEFLHRAGIDGIQYPAEYQSKGSHNEAYNYVIFDDKDIGIEEQIRFSLIGEKGAAALDKAESKETRAENLRVAAKMEKAGEEAKNIWFATGWERGKDGKWRYELPDIALKEGTYRLWLDSAETTLKSLVSDDKGLFKAYPELAKVLVTFDNMDGRGLWNREDNTITLAKDLVLDASSVRSVLLHEVQHAIQDIEGFARGSNSFAIARNTGFANIYREFFSAIKDDEDFRGMDPFATVGKALKSSKWISDNWGYKFYSDLKAIYDSQSFAGFIRKHNDWLANSKDENTPYQQYRRTAGEVEARNVQKRMGINESQGWQMANPPSATEDVAREKQIIVNDSEAAASMEEKAKLYQEGTTRREAALRLVRLIKDNGDKPVLIKSRDGEEARLSKSSIGKLVSKEAADKSIANGFAAEQHFAAAADIDNLFGNSVKVLTHKDRINDPNIVAIHRFAAPLFGDNAAYITVKEATEHGKRIYSVELIEMGKLEGKWHKSKFASSSHPTTSSPNNNIQKNPAGGAEKDVSREKDVRFSLAETAGVPESRADDPKVVKRARELWEAKGVESPFFKRWFGDSKVVDEDGKPLVVYHGGGTGINVFDYSRIGQQGRSEGAGFEFTANRSLAQGYADRHGGGLYPVYLVIQKPITDIDQKTLTRAQKAKILQKFNNKANLNEKELERNFVFADYTDNYKNTGAAIKEVLDMIGNEDTDLDFINEFMNTTNRNKEILEAFKEVTGYDGVILTKGSEWKDNGLYVAFTNTQIKSATDNRGTFSGASDDIRFSLSSLSKKEQEIAKQAPQAQIYLITLRWLKEIAKTFTGKRKALASRTSNIDTLYQYANEEWHEQKKKGKAGMEVRHSPEEDSLAERIAQEENLKHFIMENGEIDGYKAIEMASDYQGRLSDAERVELGRQAQSGYSNSGETIKDIPLEDRIENILHTEAIELDGNAHKGKYELGNRKSIANFILGKLRKTYTNLGTSDKIIISRQSGEKLATRNDEAHQKTIAHIPQIIENMQFLEEMKPDKENSSFDNYSYYITGASIDGESHTILSTVGRKNQEVYYDQNVFKGTPEEVFAKIERAGSDSKYGRLAKILQKTKEDIRDTAGIIPPEATDVQEAEAPTNKYSKNSGDEQEKSAVGEELFQDTQKEAEEAAKAEKFAANAKAEKRAKAEKQGELPMESEETEDRYASLRTKPTKWQKGVEALQDRYNFLKRAEKLAEDNTHSPYMKENLMHGRIKTLTDRIINKGVVKPVTEIIKGRQMNYADVDDYLYAMAAEHVNKNLEARNEYNKQVEAALRYGFLTKEEAAEMKHRGGSGMSEQEIRDIKEKVGASEDREHFEKILKINRWLNAAIDKIEVDSGLTSAEAVAKRRELMPDYVPMRGLPEDVEEMQSKKQTSTGKGMQVKLDNKRRGGRKSRATDVFAQNLTRSGSVIRNAEKNVVLDVMAKFSEDNPSNGVWEIDKEYERLKNDGSGEMEYDQYESEVNNVIQFYRNGEKHFLKFTTLQGKAFAEHLKGMDSQQAATIMKLLGKLNRVISANATAYSPNFVLRNGFRDWLDGSVNAWARESRKAGLTQFKETPKAAVGLLLGELGAKNEYSKAREEYHSYGGEMGFTQEHTWRKQTDVHANKFKRLEKKGLPLETVNWLTGFVSAGMDIWDRINSCIEEGPRVAYFRKLREKGIDPEKAAFAGKNLTINFDRRGSTKWIGQTWIFANAHIQGLDNKASMFTEAAEKEAKRRALEAKAIKTAMLPAGLGAKLALLPLSRPVQSMAGLYALGFISSLMGRKASGQNEDNDRLDVDNIEAHTKNSNAVMPLRKLFGRFTSFFDDKYLKMPLAQELNFVFNTGRAHADLLLSDSYTAHDYAVETVNNILDMINFTGGGIDIRDLRTTGGWAKTAGKHMPSGAKPWLDINANEDFAGRPIHKERFSQLDQTPFSSMFYDGTNPLFRDLARELNRLTGGSMEESGIIDLSPDDLEYVLKSYFGGIGLLSRQVFGIGMSISRNETPTINQFPLLNVILAEYNPGRDRKEALGFRADAYTANEKFMNLNYKKQGEKTEEGKAAAQAKIDEFQANPEKYKMWLFHQTDKAYQGVVTALGKLEKILTKTGNDAAAAFAKGRKDIRNEIAHKEIKAKDAIRKAKTKEEADKAMNAFSADAQKIMNAFSADAKASFLGADYTGE